MDKNLIARLTITREVGVQTMIEVRRGATWSAFYSYFTQTPRKPKTRKFVKSTNRNDGILSYAAQTRPGLDKLAYQWARMKGVTVSVKIFQKRAYKKLLDASPSELGQAAARPIFQARKSYERAAVVGD